MRERRKTYCCLCGRTFAAGEEYELMFWHGMMVPVCRDDRRCVPKDHGKMKKVRKTQHRYHLF